MFILEQLKVNQLIGNSKDVLSAFTNDPTFSIKNKIEIKYFKKKYYFKYEFNDNTYSM